MSNGHMLEPHLIWSLAGEDEVNMWITLLQSDRCLDHEFKALFVRHRFGVERNDIAFSKLQLLAISRHPRSRADRASIDPVSDLIRFTDAYQTLCTA